ncbi:hypothetical protein ACFVP3_05160 [Streptomyces sp. NPDC057806]
MEQPRHSNAAPHGTDVSLPFLPYAAPAPTESHHPGDPSATPKGAPASWP